MLELNYATYVAVTIDAGCVWGKLCHICGEVFAGKINWKFLWVVGNQIINTWKSHGNHGIF